MRTVIAFALLAGSAAVPLHATSLAAQDQRVPSRPRLLVGAGISAATGTAEILQTRDGSIAPGNPRSAGTTLTLGAAVRIPRSAVDLRLEGFYNRFENPAAAPYDSPAWGTIRLATVDRTIGGSATLAWHMFPRFAASPYLLTGLGVYHSRLERDAQAGDPVHIRTGAPNIAHSFGLGMRLPALGRVFLVEARRHWMHDDEPISGRDFVPLTVGMEF